MKYTSDVLLKVIKKIFLSINLVILRKDNYFNLNLQSLKKSFLDITPSNKTINIENFLSHLSKNYQESHGQLMQDLFVDFILNKEEGYFVEVGACDGLIHSNTYWLEKKRNWKGILCEPAEFWHEKLSKNRDKCLIEKRPIYNNSNQFVNFSIEKGGRSFIEKKEKLDNKNTVSLESISLNDLFFKYSVSNIDYLSVDTEGSEFEIINDLDFSKYRPSIITIEHNYEKTKRKKIFNLLSKKNYMRIFKPISKFDDWYVDKNINLNL